MVAELKRLEQELAKAIVNRDVEAVQRIEAQTYVHTDTNAKVSMREDFIRSYRAGSSDIQSIRFDDLVVDLYDNAAVVRGIATVELLNEQTTVKRVARYTRFYVRLKEGWRAVAGHSSALSPSETP